MLKSIESMTYNGVNLDDVFNNEESAPEAYFLIEEVRGRYSPPSDLSLITVPGLDGSHLRSNRKLERLLEVDVVMKGASFEDLHRRMERLAEILVVEEPVAISFEDESDRTYYGLYRGLEILEDRSKIVKFTVFITSPDPYKYGPELEAVFPSDYVTITNNGNAEADPIFILEVTNPITFAMIQNQNDEYMMIGQPADVDQSVVDERTTYFTERGQTLDQWTVDTSDNFSGVSMEVNSGFTTTGDSIIVDQWGTGTGWHGASMYREIDPTQDFELEMYVYVRTETPDRAFKISTHFFDENMKQLGMMRLWDNSRSREKKVAEARYGEFVGRNQNYVISSQNYEIPDQRVFGGILRVRRVGNKYTYYVARVTQGGRHVNAIEEHFNDEKNEFNEPLKYVQFDIAKHGDSATPNEIRVEYIKVTKLSKATVDETPYIAYPGDVITFDHKNDEILLNGEDATDLKQFGADYFKLAKGENQLIVEPSNSFAVGVEYRERYK